MYCCRACNYSTTSLKCYVLHYRIHGNVSNFRFPCGIASCFRTFTTYTALNVHCSREHCGFRKSVSCSKYRNVNVCLQCSISFCGKQFSDLQSLLRHLKSHINISSKVECPFQKCDSAFSKVSSFSSHMCRKHLNWTSDLLDDSFLASDSFSNSAQSIEPVSLFTPEVVEQNDVSDDVAETVCQPELIASQYLQNYSLFLLKLQSQNGLSVSVVQTIADEITLLHTMGKEYICKRIEGILDTLSMDHEQKALILQSIMHASIHDEPNYLLRTDHMRKKFYSENFKFVKPETLYVGVNDLNKATYVHYVPVKEMLRALLQDTSACQQLKNPIPVAEEQVLRDFNDAFLCKSNEFMKTNSNCLKLILFQDAFEVVNPLGSAKCKHKLVGVYLTLANFYPYNQSKVAHLQLVQLFKEKDLKMFGTNKIFSRLITDLQDMECNGICLPDGDIVKATVIAIVGDNLGAHTIGGFTENFSCGEFFCRFCTIGRSAFKLNSLEIGELRTPNLYDSDVQTVVNSLDNMTNCNGIKFSSTFNQLKNFHVASPGLPPCLGHDLFEGVVDYDVAIALKHFIKARKWMTYQWLNRTITKFKCLGFDVGNKCYTVNEKGHKIGGHAVQNRTLLRLLPVMIGIKILDKDDSVWRMLLLLRDVVEIVCAPQISIAQISYMQIVIEEYVELRTLLFPAVSLRPKHHYLLHYAMLTYQFGPLIRMWSLRFESKHSYFKQIARRSHNFVNVGKMLPEKHQLYQAYLSTGERFIDGVVCNNSTPLTLSVYSEAVNSAISKHLKNSLAYVSTEATLNGTNYKSELYVLMEDLENSIVAGRIMFVIVNDSSLLLLVEKYSCQWLPSHGLYVCTVFESTPIECVPVGQLLDSTPLPVYKVGELLLLPLKHKFVKI